VRKKEEYAKRLFYSRRGQYIIGQALSIAIRTMKLAKRPESSNIEDMEVLLEELFPLGKAVEQFRFDGVKQKIIEVMANFDDILKAVGIRKLRDEYKVGKSVRAIQKALNQLLEVVDGR